MFLAECKYCNELTDAVLIDSLLDKSKMVKTGFSKVAEIRAGKDGIELVRLEDMLH